MTQENNSDVLIFYNVVSNRSDDSSIVDEQDSHDQQSIPHGNTDKDDDKHKNNDNIKI